MANDKYIQSKPVIHTPVDLEKVVDVPIELYQSLRGRYFTAQTPDLLITGHTGAWGALRNPLNSGVILRMNVVTLNYVYGEPLTMGIYMNADLPGEAHESEEIAPANTACSPESEPRVKLFYATEVNAFPQGGIFSFSRTAYPGQTTMLQKSGVFAVPPGGNYCVYVDSLELGQKDSSIYIAFGFWEEPA